MRLNKRSVPVLILCLAFIAAGMILALLDHRAANAQARTVFTLTIEDTINPVKSRVIARAVATASENRAELLVIELDTPGGLYGSTREIVETLLGSDVPVAVFVSPRGAQAGSAGTFITAASSIDGLRGLVDTRVTVRSAATVAA